MPHLVEPHIYRRTGGTYVVQVRNLPGKRSLQDTRPNLIEARKLRDELLAHRSAVRDSRPARASKHPRWTVRVLLCNGQTDTRTYTASTPAAVRNIALNRDDAVRVLEVTPAS